ncbi:hypothetical protein Bca101_023592 [Brassica carinata]
MVNQKPELSRTTTTRNPYSTEEHPTLPQPTKKLVIKLNKCLSFLHSDWIVSRAKTKLKLCNRVDGDEFVFNDEATAPLYRNKVNAIEMKETVEENASTTKNRYSTTANTRSMQPFSGKRKQEKSKAILV